MAEQTLASLGLQCTTDIIKLMSEHKPSSSSLLSLS